MTETEKKMSSPKTKRLGPAESREPAGREAEGHAERIHRIERDEPLRRQILEALAQEPWTPSELAASLGVRTETVSRKLTALRNEGLVESRPVEGDRRRRHYTATEEILAAGGVELSRHRAYGEPVVPVEASAEEESAFLRLALEEAVELRRRSNQLAEAAGRLHIVLREARKRDDKPLIVEALAELVTTLRQEGKVEEVSSLLDELESFGSGEVQESPALALPALAHREYALGRLGCTDIRALTESSAHLISAANLYQQLAERPHYLPAAKWSERRAWSIVSHADNLRARSDYDKALPRAIEALRIFDQIEDNYGLTYSFFLLGFCLRLSGSFDAAHECLGEALKLAEAHSFERFQANALMQLGEVMRCRGELPAARSALEESCERAERLGLGVTSAFARSALGAVAFDEHRFAEAQRSLGEAQSIFAGHRHMTGLALNIRRHAAATRCLLSEEKEVEVEQVDHLLGQALQRYTALKSPAGVVSCQIEQGRLGLLCDRDTSMTVTALIDLLDNRTPERNMLVLDPWVPRVLDAFAGETGHEGLIERARDCVQRADRRLRDGALRVAGAMHRGQKPPEPQPRVDEMGGETRQQSDALALLSA
jgi:tetratricopeptide (TPR) repeat protein